MWFSKDFEINEELLCGIVTEDDVKRIAQIINVEKDPLICEKISFEIGLGSKIRDIKPSREPIMVMAFDIFDERFIKKHTEFSKKKNKLFKNIEEISKLLKDEYLCGAIISDKNYNEKELETLILLADRALPKNTLIEIDLYQQNRERDLKWGKEERYTQLTYYKKFLEKVLSLYTELCGNDFTCHFHKDVKSNKWEPLTEGTRFLSEFHEIINRFAKAYNTVPFTDQNFKNACEDFRNQKNNFEE